jgi:uncharacterized protein YbcI
VGLASVVAGDIRGCGGGRFRLHRRVLSAAEGGLSTPRGSVRKPGQSRISNVLGRAHARVSRLVLELFPEVGTEPNGGLVHARARGCHGESVPESSERSNIGDIASELASDFATHPPEDRGETLAAISNAMVRLYKEYFGRGPTRVRTHYQGDTITCVLRDGFTRAEQTLIRADRKRAVLDQRREMQQAVRDEFTSTITHITGRKVIGFFSDTQHDPDMSVEVFVLAPDDSDA